MIKKIKRQNSNKLLKINLKKNKNPSKKQMIRKIKIIKNLKVK